MEDLIKIWDQERIEMHIGIEINYLKEYFKDKNIDKLNYVDIGANVGKFYDVLSRTYNIESVVMVEPAPQLYQYLLKKFQDVSNCKIYDFAVSNVDGETYFQTSSIDKSTIDHINMGVSKIHDNEGHLIKVVSGRNFLKNYVSNLENIDFIKIDTESRDYEIIESITPIIETLNKKPFILFEHNYHGSLSAERAENIINNFTNKCNYESVDFKKLSGDCYLQPL